MPLAIWEKYEDGSEIEAEVIEDGADVTVAVEFPNGERKLIVAIAPCESALSYVMNVDFGDSFPEPSELAYYCENPDNLRAIMVAGEQHEIKLLKQEDGPISIIIQHLGSEALNNGTRS
jgi:hypothetical protein